MPYLFHSQNITVKEALIGAAIFVGGGVAFYSYTKFNAKRRKKYRNPHTDDISEVKMEILELKRTLNLAIADFRRDVEGIRKSLLRKSDQRKEKRKTGRRLKEEQIKENLKKRYDLRSVTNNSDEDDDDDFHSIEDFPVNSTGRISLIDDICAEVDRLNEGDDSDKTSAMEILQDQEIIRPTESRILWRLARAHVGYFEMRDDKEVRHLHATSALEYARSALRSDKDSVNAHKWCAIALGICTEFASTKEKIESGFELKEHLDRALELDPNEPVLHYMKGRWCWGVYMLTWIERKLAATLFAQPPTSSVDEALQSFLQAEDIDPGFLKANRLYIAKCYYDKADYPHAKKWANLTLALPITSKDDQDSHTEAETLADKL